MGKQDAWAYMNCFSQLAIVEPFVFAFNVTQIDFRTRHNDSGQSIEITTESF